MLNFTSMNQRKNQTHTARLPPLKTPTPTPPPPKPIPTPPPPSTSIVRTVLEGVGFGVGSSIGRSIVEQGFNALRTDTVSSPAKQLHAPSGHVTPSSSTGLRPPDLESNALLTTPATLPATVSLPSRISESEKSPDDCESHIESYGLCIKNKSGTVDYRDCEKMYDDYINCITIHPIL